MPLAVNENAEPGHRPPCAAAQQPPPPIGIEFLTDRAVFTDNVDLKLKDKLDGKRTEVANVKDPSRTVTARITVQPGAAFGWHTHPGPVVVNVVEGELTFVAADDCAEREYPEGTAFIDVGGDHVHNAFNATGGTTVLVATFFRAPPLDPGPPRDRLGDPCAGACGLLDLTTTSRTSRPADHR
jgi:quercetin dioxygenase-like cupin family protein